MVVLSEGNKILGRLRKEMAPKFSSLLQKLTEKNYTMEGQITGNGDGYIQPGRVKIVKLMPVGGNNNNDNNNNKHSTNVQEKKEKAPALTTKISTYIAKNNTKQVVPPPPEHMIKMKEQVFYITITGMKAKGKINDKIKLLREPENVSSIFFFFVVVINNPSLL